MFLRRAAGVCCKRPLISSTLLFSEIAHHHSLKRTTYSTYSNLYNDVLLLEAKVVFCGICCLDMELVLFRTSDCLIQIVNNKVHSYSGMNTVL